MHLSYKKKLFSFFICSRFAKRIRWNRDSMWTLKCMPYNCCLFPLIVCQQKSLFLEKMFLLKKMMIKIIVNDPVNISDT